MKKVHIVTDLAALLGIFHINKYLKSKFLNVYIIINTTSRVRVLYHYRKQIEKKSTESYKMYVIT